MRITEIVIDVCRYALFFPRFANWHVTGLQIVRRAYGYLGMVRNRFLSLGDESEGMITMKIS
jgi:hypothetical protein